MQRLVHAYAPIYVRHDALPMQTRYVEHGRRGTQHAFAMEIERGEPAPLLLRHTARFAEHSKNYASYSSFSYRLRLAQFRNSRYYGELESIKFVLLFEIMVENNGFSLSYRYSKKKKKTSNFITVVNSFDK